MEDGRTLRLTASPAIEGTVVAVGCAVGCAAGCAVECLSVLLGVQGGGGYRAG